MELARNPNMLQELMRTQDRAMSNLEVWHNRIISFFLLDVTSYLVWNIFETIFFSFEYSSNI